MSKQTQPRPPISKRHLSTYRYRRIDKVVNGVKYFKYYDTSIETLNEQKSFATYVLSRNGTKPLNRTLSPLIETKARRWPLVTWRTNPDNTDLNYAPYPITDAYTKNIGRIQDVAVARAVASIKDAKVDLLTFWAERQKTADMLRHRLMQAYYALRAIKRLDLAKAVRIVKNGKSPKSLRAADLRLELVYGWGPFLSDIYGLCGMKPPPLDQKIKEFFGEPQNFSEEVTNNYPRQNAVGTKTFKGKTSAVVMLEIEVDTPLIVSAGQLGLTNPLNTAWELVPFSFVVDWFIPIQQYIEQYDALDGIYVKDQLLITKARYTSTFDTMFHGSSMYSYRRMERTKVFSLNPPPHFKNPVSIDHVLNALALIRSVKGGTRGWRFG